MDSLTPSQVKLYTELEVKLDEHAMYRNYILTGISGSGKSYILKKLSQDKNYKYIEFEEDFGKDFFVNNDYRVTDEMILLRYIETQVDNKNSNQTIIIDNLNSILNSILEKNRVNNLIGGFLRRKYRNKYILVIPEEYLENQDLEVYDRVFKLNYNEEDNRFLSDVNRVTEVVSKDYKNGHYYVLSK